MAASFTIAARNNGFAKADARAATLASVTSYRQAVAAFAQMPTMDIWYARLDEDEVMRAGRTAVAEVARQPKAAKKKPKVTRKAAKEKKKEAIKADKAAAKAAEKARTRDSLQALSTPPRAAGAAGDALLLSLRRRSRSLTRCASM